MIRIAVITLFAGFFIYATTCFFMVGDTKKINPIMQEVVFIQSQDIVKEITQDFNVEPQIRKYLLDCKFFKHNPGTTINYELKGASCMILIANELPGIDFTPSFTSVIFTDDYDWISYVILYPYELSDESGKRVIVREAVNMIDFIDRYPCSEVNVACNVHYAYLAHKEALVLLKDYTLKNGFTIEQLSEVDPDSDTDPLIQFAKSNSISEDDYNLFIQDLILLRENLKGNLRRYLLDTYSY